MAVRRNLAYGQDPNNRVDIFLPKKRRWVGDVKPNRRSLAKVWGLEPEQIRVNRSGSGKYLAQRKGKPPAIMLLHGGAWHGGGREIYEQRGLAQRLAKRGYVVGVPDYTHADIPAQVKDVSALARWMRAHAGAWGFNPKHLAALGDSAGGHLALEAARRGAVNAVVTRSAPTDLTAMNSTLPEGHIENVMGGAPAPAYSPINYAQLLRAPTLMMGTQGDPLVGPEHALRMRAAGGPNLHTRILPGSQHAYMSEAIPWALRFLSRQFARSAA